MIVDPFISIAADKRIKRHQPVLFLCCIVYAHAKNDKVFSFVQNGLPDDPGVIGKCNMDIQAFPISKIVFYIWYRIGAFSIFLFGL